MDRVMAYASNYENHNADVFERTARRQQHASKTSLDGQEGSLLLAIDRHN